MTTEEQDMTNSVTAAKPSGSHGDGRNGAGGTPAQAEGQGDAEGHPRDGWVYAIRTAPFGNVLYEADSPEACIAAAEASKTGAGYFPEYDVIVGRPKPIEPDPWTVVVAASDRTAQ